MSNAAGVLGPSTTPVHVTCSPNLWLLPSQSATVATGQTDLTSNVPGVTSATSLNHPQGRVYVNPSGVLYVADTSNNRVVGYLPVPQKSSAAASFVLGQNNSFTTTVSGSDGNSFTAPSAVHGDGTRLYISDTLNNRILVYRNFPYGQASADFAVGQASLTAAGSACSATGLAGPRGIFVSGTTLYVADTSNHRVLMYTPLPTGNGNTATVALGQASLNACAANRGGAPSSASLSGPQDVWSDGSRVFVADTGNNRVLVWSSVPGASGASASFVIGQTSMVGSSSGVSAVALNGPSGIAGTSSTVYIADTQNSRVLGFAMPTGNGPSATLLLGQTAYNSGLCNTGTSVGASTLCQPTGVSLTLAQLTVTDTNNNRIIAFGNQTSSQTFTLGGSVSGLSTNTNVTLANGNDIISVGNGNFAFTLPVANAANFNVTITQPTGQNCNFVAASGTGVMPASNDFNIVIACVPDSYTLGGTITGLVTGNVTVTNTMNADAIAAGNGNYVFDQNIDYNDVYAVVAVPPAGQSCTVSNANGIMPAATVGNVLITCSPNDYILGGAVSGLVTNTNVVLTNLNNNDVISVGNGNYAFDTSVTYYTDFNIAITQPVGQNCNFVSGSGNTTMPPSDDYNVVIVCTPITYTIGGNVSGLVTGNVTLTNINNNDIITPANGNYLFDQNVAYGSDYNVTLSPPNGQHCSIVNPNGTMPAYSVQNINVVCSPNAYILGGSVSGLLSNTNITITNTLNADAISVGDGNFAFDTLVNYYANFNVTITQPTGQNCNFVASSGAGVMPASNDYNIVIACVPDSYALGGNVTGLVTGNVTVTNTMNADAISVGNGNYVFDQNIDFNDVYAVVAVPPAGQSCTVSNANGIMPAATVGNVLITCSPNHYILGGAVSGLVNNTNVVLTNLNNNDVISVGNGNYAFDALVTYFTDFNVAITQPAGQNCNFVSGSGNTTMPPSNDYNVVIVCTQKTYTIGGNVSGLVTGNVTLKNLNNNDTITPANGNYLFDQNVSYGSNYNVTLTPPNGQHCSIVNPNGIMPAYSVQNINVVCSPNTYTLGGSVSGLVSSANITLTNALNADAISVGNGNFAFDVLVAYHANFNVTITQAAGQTCVFSSNSNSGTMPAANDHNIVVTCTQNTYTIGGNVSGLVTGNVTFTNLNNNDVITPGNGNYLFDQNISYAGNYNVAVTQPTGQNCNIVNPNGTMPAYSVQNINVVCAAKSYSLGGSVSGFAGNTNLTLTNLNNNDTVSMGNGNFTFTTPVNYFSNFNVTITQPAGLSCVFASGSNTGTMPAANDANILVNCTAATYTIGGNVSGLVTGNVTLTNISNADAITPANGNYLFDQNVSYGSNYNVTSRPPTANTVLSSTPTAPCRRTACKISTWCAAPTRTPSEAVYRAC